MEWVGCRGKSVGKEATLWRVFQPQGKLSVRSWAGAGQVDIRSYRGENREGGALGGTHVGDSGVWGGGQSKSDEDRMTVRASASSGDPRHGGPPRRPIRFTCCCRADHTRPSLEPCQEITMKSFIPIN